MKINRRLKSVLIAGVIVFAGLLVRRPELGLPWPVAKWSGSILWGAMLYFLIASLRPEGRRSTVFYAAAAIAVLVELSRLYHAPWLDDFRSGTAGALLLGRLFSPFNILAYLIGIGAAGIADMRWINSRATTGQALRPP